MRKKLPHIIIFNPESYRGDVMGHIGNEGAATPNIDKMVQEDAVSFSNAFSQNPVCTPSRCSFMSGWYPHVRGHRSMLHMLKRDEPNLLKKLKDLGYYVWWGGKNDLVSVKEHKDYLYWCDEKYSFKKENSNVKAPEAYKMGEPEYYSFYKGVFETDSKEDFIGNDVCYIEGAIDLIKNPPEDRPLCIYLPLSLVHPPYAIEDYFAELIDKAKLPPRVSEKDLKGDFPKIMKRLREVSNMDGLDEEFWKNVKSVYYAMCAKIDALFGKLADGLKEAGIYEDTSIFFFSDHGDFTGDYGLPEKTHGTLQDCLLNVPFIVKPPKNIPVKPGIRSELIELVDFPATVMEMLDISVDWPQFGKSLLGLIEGEKEGGREAVFAEVGRRPEETQCLNSETSSLPKEHPYWPQSSVSREDSSCCGYAAMCRTEKYKYIRRLYDTDEFYDLKKDPKETNNLKDDPEYKEEMRKLQYMLLDFYMRTSDVVPFEQDTRKI